MSIPNGKSGLGRPVSVDEQGKGAKGTGVFAVVVVQGGEEEHKHCEERN